MINKQALLDLIDLRIKYKRSEDEAAAKRKAIDIEIADALHAPNVKSITQHVEGYKVSVTYGTNVKVDTDAVQTAWGSMPAPLQAAFKFKAELVAAGVKALAESDAVLLAAFVTTTPASPSVKVELA